MTTPDALRLLIDALEGLQIPYMLVGALSVNQYAPPRSTNDADVVIDAQPAQLAQLAARLQPLAHLDRQLTFETATGTRRTIVKVTGTEYRIELFHVSQDPHDQQRFQRRLRADLEGFSVWVPTAEDVILWKLRWILAGGRSKDRDDVRSILAVQGPRLDKTYLEHWTTQHGTGALLREIVASLPLDLQPEQLAAASTPDSIPGSSRP